ncbi:MAG: hypothetical protein K2J70_06770 [Muribaculaceae bacterium]|nr:hypothetical protein [Muribaculaceae bacterium]
MATKDRSLLRPLDEAPAQVFVTNRLQVADILDHVLRWTGPADVWLATFSVSEEFLRHLHFLNDSEKRILSAQLIIDYKAAQKTMKLWEFIEQVFQASFMADNHSKILLVASPDRARLVSVITSQNLTRGNRFESSFLTTDPVIFKSMLADWNSIASHNSIPLDDFLRSTIEGNRELRFDFL